MQLVKWLSVVLSISLGANLWFIYSWSTRHIAPIVNTSDIGTAPQLRPSHAWQQDSLSDDRAGNSKPGELFSGINTRDIKRSQDTYLAWLKSLVQTQEFELLEFEVRAYLRLYPQDIEAMLLEAQAYYHNKPLSVALVHYHELLSQPLNVEQYRDIEELIAVNTTRVIQQFSGDGAWNLLAQFLEPLVQIAPRNRQYLMALATAYGMQSQLTLMEDVLASFSSDDIRANRLRQNVNARLNQSNRNNELASLPNIEIDSNLRDTRQADVVLTQQRGQFVTPARINNTRARLLVDTGASTTAISSETFAQINPNEMAFLGLFNVNTAGGLIEAPIYKVAQITIGERTISNTSVLVLPSENLGSFDGLLGMNVLSQFDLHYDATTQTMRMYKKR